MRRRTAVSLVAASLLFGCAHEQPASLGAPGMAWELTPASGPADEAKLAYGVPDSDAVELMLTCRPKSGGVTIATFGPSAPARPVLTVTSGTVSTRLPASAENNEAGEGVLISATAPVGDPALRAFARTGKLAVGVRGGHGTLPPADPGVAGRFLAGCRR